jgi:excinuclease ABC subunit A
VKWRNRYGREMRYSSGFEGVVPYIERQYTQAETDTQRQRWAEYLREVPCPVCHGDRLKPEVLAVLVHGPFDRRCLAHEPRRRAGSTSPSSS